MPDTNNPRIEVDDLCAGAQPAKNGLEERLDMIVAQLSVIAIELDRIANGREEKNHPIRDGL